VKNVKNTVPWREKTALYTRIYPRGIVGKVHDCHLNVLGSIFTPDMVYRSAASPHEIQANIVHERTSPELEGLIFLVIFG
jgi:hypothetical protein